ncbi:hypothetical protein BDY21DRAFT_400149 [Lineolata rhizophorae]|uniref:DNA polymerase kappa n=1 Tax=Lineolata rhizophorae TaxID=578093 RepID=A0A6A6NR59_9PEZI|nr:hypothetical protein BDY21DRAFT_400149 [Lineolata rhizophorae]
MADDDSSFTNAPPPSSAPATQAEVEEEAILASVPKTAVQEEILADKSHPEHETLKYHLLGPSLTKAGQDKVDQQKVSEIIYEASKGSKFFLNEEAKDAALTAKIDRLLAKCAELQHPSNAAALAASTRRADDLIARLELSRTLTQSIVHIDCDAFYAAVELLSRPSLRDRPFAVGGGVLTTCSYAARRFGVRSGMASFVARKLCPELALLPLNFARYGAKARQVRGVLARFDPRFEAASIDEAYLDVTAYCDERGLTPAEAVARLRAAIREETHVTVSAGIAPNAKIAKIASNRNKPDGQFEVPRTRQACLEFMRDLPVRNVNGVGRVLERELAALGIKTCGDIYPARGYLAKLLGDKAFEFLIHTYLGLGRTTIRPAEEYERKSVGTERTFADLSGERRLREKLRDIARELEEDLKSHEVKGRTLVLKVKLHTYEVITRQTVPARGAVWRSEDTFREAEPLLAKLEKEIPGLKLRLMGLRVTGLVSTRKVTTDEFFGVGKRATGTEPAGKTKLAQEDEVWESWPEEEFEQEARRERREEMAQLEKWSQEAEAAEQQQLAKAETASGMSPHMAEMGVDVREDGDAGPERWECPVCARLLPAVDRSFNDHVDLCLSRHTIRQVARNESDKCDGGVDSTGEDEAAREPSPPSLMTKMMGAKPPAPVKKKRGRPSTKDTGFKKRKG